MPTGAGCALLDTFDRIRIINLRHRSDRRREMAAELARLGLLIDGERIAIQDASRPDEAGAFPSIGAHGCFMSHLTILREAYAAGTQRLLILEDDLDFVSDAEIRLAPSLALLESAPWSIFYGGYERFEGKLDDSLLTRADPSQSIQTTHFLAFSRTAIETAVPYLEAMLARPAGDAAGGPMHVDGAYSWLRREHPHLTTWLASPELGHQRPSRTDIHQLRRLDRTPVIRQILDLGRRVKRYLGKHKN